ncbi:MAG: type II secretion system F family protein [Actinomycetota bacterium]
MLDQLAQLPTEVALFILALLSALMALGWSMYVLMYGPRARLKRRMAAVVGAAPTQRKSSRLAVGAKRRSIQSRLKQVEEGRARGRGWRLREQLQQAAIRVEPWQYLAATGGLAVAIFAVARLAALPPLWSLIAALVLGLGLPKLVVGIMARRRINRFTGQFADALDVIVRGIRSGLPLGECIGIIGREMPDPVGAEFRQVSEGQRLGLSLQDAIARAVERMPTPELRFFAIVIAIQQQTGGNLAETLAKLSDVLRARKRMRDKVQAFASEARASAMIIGSLPIVVTCILSVVAPAYIGILFTTEMGNVLIFIGLTVMGMGALVMRNMINFDI